MFLDSSIIVELMRGGKDSPFVIRILKKIENEILFVSIVQLGEISDWCNANGIDAGKRISQLNDIVVVIPLNDTICMDASEIKHRMRSQKVAKFSLMDGLILASARYIDQKLLTMDSDFRKADGAIVLE